MLLIIHNLPIRTQYADIKDLIAAKCGLRDCILDKLEVEGTGLRVTVGVSEEEDAAILVRKINGLYYRGQQLYVENKRQKKDSEQPYRIDMPQTEYIQPVQPVPAPIYDYNAQMQAMGMYQQLGYMQQMQAAGQQSVQNPYMAYGAQHLMVPFTGQNEFAQAIVQEPEDRFGTPSLDRGQPRRDGTWEASLRFDEVRDDSAPNSNSRRRPANSPPPNWNADYNRGTKRSRWNSSPANQRSDRSLDRCRDRHGDNFQDEIRGHSGQHNNFKDETRGLSSQHKNFQDETRGRSGQHKNFKYETHGHSGQHNNFQDETRGHSGHLNRFQDETRDHSGHHDRFQDETCDKSGLHNRYKDETRGHSGQHNRFKNETRGRSDQHNNFHDKTRGSSGQRNNFQDETRGHSGQHKSFQEETRSRLSQFQNSLKEKIQIRPSQYNQRGGLSPTNRPSSRGGRSERDDQYMVQSNSRNPHEEFTEHRQPTSTKDMQKVKHQAMSRLFDEFSKNPNLKDEFKDTSPLNDLVMKLIVQRIDDIMGNSPMATREIYERYRQIYPRSTDFLVFWRLKQKLKENRGDYASPKLLEYISSMVQAPTQPCRQQPTEPADNKSKGPTKRTQEQITAMKKIMGETCSRSLTNEPELEKAGPIKKALRDTIFLRIDELTKDQHVSVEEICKLYRKLYPFGEDRPMFATIKKELIGHEDAAYKHSFTAAFKVFLKQFVKSFTAEGQQTNLLYNVKNLNVCLHEAINCLMVEHIKAAADSPMPVVIKFALRILVQMRVQDITRNNFMKPEDIISCYRIRYPATTDSKIYLDIKTEILEKGYVKRDITVEHKMNEFLWSYVIQKPRTQKQKLRTNKHNVATNVLIEMLIKLNALRVMNGSSPLKTALRKAIIFRVDYITQGKEMSEEEIMTTYWQTYTFNSHIDFYCTIKAKLEEMGPNWVSSKKDFHSFLHSLVAPSTPAPAPAPVTQELEQPNLNIPTEDKHLNLRTQLRICVMHSMSRLLEGTKTYLNIEEELKKSDVLKRALRKLIILRLRVTMNGKLLSIEDICHRYRQIYPHYYDRNVFNAIKEKIAEKGESLELLNNQEFQDFLSAFVDVPRQPPPKAVPQTAPPMPKPVSPRKVSEQKQQIPEPKSNKVSPIYKRAIDEELLLTEDLISKELENPQNEVDELFCSGKEVCIERIKQTVAWHLSNRITNHGKKSCLLICSPRLPKRYQLESLLSEYNYTSLQKRDDSPYYVASFRTYDTVDLLCNMPPHCLSDNIKVTFKYIESSDIPLRMSQKHYKMLRDKYTVSLIDKSQVNLLDSNWQKVEAKEKKDKGEKMNEEDDDVIVIESDNNTIDITGDDPSDDMVVDDWKDTNVEGEDDIEFTLEDFKVIDEVYASDDDDDESPDDNGNSAQDKFKEISGEVLDDWVNNGESWSEDVTTDVNNGNKTDKNDEKSKNVSSDTSEHNKEIGNKVEEKSGKCDEAVDDDENDELNEEIGVNEDVDLTQIDWDNVDEEDLEDY